MSERTRTNIMIVTFKEPTKLRGRDGDGSVQRGGGQHNVSAICYFTRTVSDEAEPCLLAALKLDPASSMANTTLGMVKMDSVNLTRRNNFEKATASDQKNHLAFYATRTC